MGQNSKIEWTDHTWNPWIGCTKVAAGCQHCYAESFAERYGMAMWGPNGTRVKTSESYWRQPLKWNREAEKAGVRARVFCASLADVFEDWDKPVRVQHGDDTNMLDCRTRLFALIDATPWLDWLLLTKRPENIRRMWPYVPHTVLQEQQHQFSGFRKNVWLGTSVATQNDADRNIPELLTCRDLAPVLFVSAEPLIGPVDLTRLPAPCELQKSPNGGLCYDALKSNDARYFEPPGRMDWVICGGESGHGARPMHPDWVRSLRDQCHAASVPFFFKQWGEWLPFATNAFEEHLPPNTPESTPVCLVKRDGRIFRQYSFAEHAPGVEMARVGKKHAGRLLDGREHNEFPMVETAQ